VLTVAVAITGPSVLEPVLPGKSWQPPWSFDVHLSPYLAVALTAAALAAGTAGLALTLRAMQRGWSISPRAVLLAGIIAAAVLTLLPPFGSSDHLSYAAYGRMFVTGHNPYTTTPAMLAAHGDPIAKAVQDWFRTPSDYGTLATGGQALASLIGGTSVRLTVFVLGLLNLAAFAGTALLLHHMTRASSRRQLRTALLWTCNPLLLQELVAGAHLDSQAIVFGVAALAVLASSRHRPVRSSLCLVTPHSVGGNDTQTWRGPRPLLFSRLRGPEGDTGAWYVLRCVVAGGLVGLGFAVKVTLALVGLGLAVACLLVLWRQWRRLAASAGGLALGFALTAGPALAIGGSAGFKAAVQASSMVSIGSPWRTVRTLLHLMVHETTADDIVKTGAIILAVALAILLLRGLPGVLPHPANAGDSRRESLASRVTTPRSGVRDKNDGDHELGEVFGGAASLVVFALVLAWLFAWPYLLPWYDALAWAFLPLLPASRVDWMLLARTAALAFGYLPARVADTALPGGLHWLQSVVRTGVTPAILLLVTVLLAVTMWRAGKRSFMITEVPVHPGAPELPSSPELP
jgi:hypothetical protein